MIGGDVNYQRFKVGIVHEHRLRHLFAEWTNVMLFVNKNYIVMFILCTVKDGFIRCQVMISDKRALTSCDGKRNTRALGSS